MRTTPYLIEFLLDWLKEMRALVNAGEITWSEAIECLDMDYENYLAYLGEC